MSAGPCGLEADFSFGPSTVACRRDFDFTLVFEETILTIAPAALFLLLAALRVFQLYKAPVICRHGKQYFCKLGACVVSGALQAAILIQLSVSAATRTPVSIGSASLSTAAGIFICIVSGYEHLRSIRPSSLLIVFLSFSILFEAARTRTYWLIGDTALAGTLLASLLSKCLLLLVENYTKKQQLLRPHLQEKAAEELAGPISKTFFQWLNVLFIRGYKELLAPADISPIDSRLTSSVLRVKFAAIEEKSRNPAGFSNNGLMLLTLKSLGWNLISPVIARLAVIAFTFAQPFLVTAMLDHLSSRDAAPRSHGYGLIGASLLIFGGIAISHSWYGHQSNRAVVMMRGGLCFSIFEKLLRLREVDELESRATTLMISDIERIVRSFAHIHDVWAALVEIPLATWLLYRQLGIACFAMLGLVSVSGFFIIWVSKLLSGKQQQWLVAVQTRLAATKKMLASLKAVKMVSADSRVSKLITHLRGVEIQAASPFRRLLVVTLFLSYSAVNLAPPLVFGVFVATSASGGGQTFNTSTIFTSLILITLFSSPLVTVFQVLPSIGAAHGCFLRIQAFLELEERQDPRAIAENAGDGAEKSKPTSGIVLGRTTVLSFKNASFGWSQETAMLSGIDLDVKAGRRIAITGRVGTGKTLLLKALLGEVNQLSGSLTVAPSTTFAYCSQSPWLENVSAELNLTQYGSESKTSAKYLKIAQDCALDDIVALPEYASGLIGSAGSTLSGGQRQRLIEKALARALSLESDVVLLDDVFSALDRKTRWRIARSLFSPRQTADTASQTIIYATHDRRIAALADDVYTITEDGKLERAVSQTSEDEEDPSAEESEYGTGEQENGGSGVGHPSAQTATAEVSRQARTSDKEVYGMYFRSIGTLHGLTFLVLGITFAVTLKLPDLWMQWWAGALAAGDTRNGYWLGFYTMLQVVPLVTLSLWEWHVFFSVVPRSGTSLHDRLLRTVLSGQYPFMSRVDTGSMMNRFNQDLMFVDQMLPMDLSNTVSEFFTAAIQVVLIAIASLHVLSAVPVLGLVLYAIQHFYLRTSKQLRLLDLESKAALHTKIAEAAGGSGLSTIRAHGWSDIIMVRFLEKFDRSQEPVYLLLSVQRWLYLVLNLVVAGLVMVVAGVSISLRDSINAGAVGVAFLNATTVGQTMTHFIVAWTGLETSLGAISRIASFEKETPRETDPDPDGGPGQAAPEAAAPPNWPQQGGIRFENVWATYSSSPAPSADEPDPDGQRQWSLRGVTLEVRPGERVTICGRTGSGKSTMLLALLRMVHVPVGSVVIDGVDHSTLPLRRLRGGFLVISQDQFQESGGSLRQELDPEGAFADAEIEDILRACGRGIWERVAGAGGLSARRDDVTFSAGEAQLLSVARTVLYGTRMEGGIVLLDEATSSVDRETELKIEELITTRLANKTVVAVNHRLEAALGYDKIIVLDNGRVSDIGTPQELVERCDLFSGLSVRGQPVSAS